MGTIERLTDSLPFPRSISATAVWKGRIAFSTVLAALVICQPPASAQFSTADLSSGASEMIGKPAPQWSPRGWVNSEPMDVRALRGKVVLVRFFSDTPTGAVALRDWNARFREQGLVMVGFYMPTPMPSETDPLWIKDLAEALGFHFPVGNDSQWQTVNRYWLDRADAQPGSMTFLIDRKGIIRYIQPDGRYEKGARDRKARAEYERLEQQMVLLLQEPATEEESRP